MPKIVDHDHRRKEIALLALDAMRAVGIENASIRGIAKRGGLSLGVLTHYFKTKDDLIVFTFRWLTEHTFTQLDRLLADCAPGLAQLEAAIDTMFPKASEPAALALWMSLWDRAIRNPAFAREHCDYYRRWRSHVKRFLRDAIELQQASATLDVDTATDLIVGAVDGLWIAMTMEPRRFTAERRRILLRRLIDGVTKSKS